MQLKTIKTSAAAGKELIRDAADTIKDMTAANLRRLSGILKTAETLLILITVVDIALFLASACSEEPVDGRAAGALVSGAVLAVAGIFLQGWNEELAEEAEDD